MKYRPTIKRRSPLPLGMGGAVADGFFGEEGLLADPVGNFREFALEGADSGEVVWLADEVEGGVAADHRRRIVEHLEECFVEGGAGSVLAHDPGISVANFFDRVGGKTDHFWVPEAHARVVASHALTELNEGVLDAAWVLFILEVFGDLF